MDQLASFYFTSFHIFGNTAQRLAAQRLGHVHFVVTILAGFQNLSQAFSL
jgi:hypothetical protein